MATRCQVQVIQKSHPDDKLTLYHHWDGYPENIVHLIIQANKMYGQGWEGGRVGKVAGILCAVDPKQFEPEQGNELHGDIEYLYRIYITEPEGGHLDDKIEPVWEVQVLTVNSDFEEKLSEEERLKVIDTFRLSANVDEEEIDQIVQKYRLKE